jgi:hypothetical protein
MVEYPLMKELGLIDVSFSIKKVPSSKPSLVISVAECFKLVLLAIIEQISNMQIVFKCLRKNVMGRESSFPVFAALW